MTRKALIVDDEQELGLILAEHLKHWGYEPTVLTEGKHVVEWATKNRPDVILLDLMLPDVDGYTICETLKLERETNLIPIIMITALSEQKDKLHGMQVGANAYLTKPFTADTLHQAIRNAFDWLEDLHRNGTHGAIRFHLPSDSQYLEELNHLLGSLFLFSGLTKKQVKQFTTAVRELGANAIEWGHERQVDRIVTLDYRIDPEKITIDIKDTGPGFNPDNLPHAAKPDDSVSHTFIRDTLGMREGGFGILMSRGLVDEMTYNDKGNEVRLIKYFSVRDHLRTNESTPLTGSPN
jgi:CheY-like chemotaxis protein/anti-sigma regulatory factor (Ser/Thr protein kinase)